MTSRHDDDNEKKKYHVLILGASYGNLLATKLLLAGHDVTLVCREVTAALFNSEGSLVRIPTARRSGDNTMLAIHSKDLDGTLKAAAPEKVTSLKEEFDLVVLAMQEPQYSAPGVRQLVKRIATCRKPTMAITNMPLLPYLERIPGLKNVSADEEFRSCFLEASLWDDFDSSVLTQCSPDPQAFRPPDETPNVLQVRLATNFKAAKFALEQHTQILQQLERDIEASRWNGDKMQQQQQQQEVPVKLRVYDSVFVPLAKWAMLMTGNYRCIIVVPAVMVAGGQQQDTMLSIRDAVWNDVEASRTVYEWVVDVCIGLGGSAEDFVPFDKYAQAAKSLGNPSSAARALKEGALNIERVDKLVALIAAQQGKRLDAIDAIVATVDSWLSRNRTAVASK